MPQEPQSLALTAFTHLLAHYAANQLANTNSANRAVQQPDKAHRPSLRPIPQSHTFFLGQ